MLSNVQFIFENIFRDAGNPLPSDIIFFGVETRSTKFTTRFTYICSKLGFENLTVHSLRHTFSTRADKFKVGAFAQKNLLGHSKLSMTDRYTHVSKETLKDSLSGFEQYLIRRKDKNNFSDEKNITKPLNLLEFKRNIN